jgi:hypothetical protein
MLNGGLKIEILGCASVPGCTPSHLRPENASPFEKLSDSARDESPSARDIYGDRVVRLTP